MEDKLPRAKRNIKQNEPPTGWEQFRAGWNSAGWLVPFTLYLLPISLMAALLWRVIAPPKPAEGPPVPHEVVVGIAGLLLGGAILISLGAFIVRLARWITKQYGPEDADSRSSSSLGRDSSSSHSRDSSLSLSLSAVTALMPIARALAEIWQALRRAMTE